MKRVLVFLVVLLPFFSLGQYSRVIIDDKAELISPTINNFLVQKLNTNGVVLDEFLDYENRCNYLYFTITGDAENLILSSRDCEKNQMGEIKFDSDLKLASEESIGKVLGNEILKMVTGNSTAIPVKNASNLYTNHHDSRYFFAPSAYNLKKGQLYYNTLYFLAHDVQYGITDNFSMGLGTTVGFFPAYVSPKFSHELSDKVSIMAGDLFIFGTYVPFYANLLYSGFTFGNKNRNITISGGILNSDLFPSTKGLLNVSSMLSASPYLYFVTENYLATIGFNTTASRITGYEPNSWGGTNPISEFKDFSIDQTILGGFSGVRIISKRKDVQSFQFGFAYVIPLQSSIPNELTSDPSWSYWDNTLTRAFVLPGISYTLKFGKVY